MAGDSISPAVVVYLNNGGLHVLTVGLFPNANKQTVVTVLDRMVQYFQERGVCVLLPKDVAQKIGYPDLGCSQQDMVKNIRVGITIGGDGTLLNTAREVASAGIPICGINMGKLGFLTEVELPELASSLDKLISGEYQIEEHLMLDAMIIRKNRKIYVSTALNDIVISKNGVSRMIKFNLSIDNEQTANYAADGLIIATATGSTGYSLSAGGPIINPLLKVMVLTPICSHTLHVRPLVISEEEEIKVEMIANQEDVVLTIDGQTVYSLLPSDTVLVKRSSFRAKFIRLNNRSYYETLRTKLWRSVKNADA
jgi:NAD+ kinase